MHVDVEAEDLHPLGVLAVHGAAELRLHGVPVLLGLEWDMRGRVVHQGEGREPKVESQPRHEPELDEAEPARLGHEEGPRDGGEGGVAGDADGDLLLLGLLVERQVKVPLDPVQNRRQKLDGSAKNRLGGGTHERGHFFHFLDHHGVPGGVLHEHVRLGVVLRVLDAPGLVRVNQGRHQHVAHHILNVLRRVEAPVPAVVAEHEEAREGRAGDGPRHGQEPKGRECNQHL
mmetsp:Transcript_1913/g.4889  ORF Transcript_1913/g.4889 Transcript_1913/m.4889 type:complete len:230 (+) Transcript_1913:791-1480(+)